MTLQIVQIALLVAILIVLSQLTSRLRADRGGGSGTDSADITSRLDAITDAQQEMRSQINNLQRDQEILDELEESVMDEWAHVIEEKLGKRPVMVACPKCGYEGGLEPNLLAEVDQEYGCPNCRSIYTLDHLREVYPEAKL